MRQYNKSMNPTHPATLPIAAGQLPPVPLTVEGYATLHQMMRFRWTAWRAIPDNARREIAAEAAKLLAEMEAESTEKSGGQSALFSLLGHKGDLMLVHFRETFDQLQTVDRTQWRREVMGHEELFLLLHDHLPPEMIYERELLI